MFGLGLPAGSVLETWLGGLLCRTGSAAEAFSSAAEQFRCLLLVKGCKTGCHKLKTSAKEQGHLRLLELYKCGSLPVLLQLDMKDV